jgi:hypothetical protein
LKKIGIARSFSGKVDAGLPQENAPSKMARIPIAKPAPTFAEYALMPIFSFLNFRGSS